MRSFYLFLTALFFATTTLADVAVPTSVSTQFRGVDFGRSYYIYRPTGIYMPDQSGNTMLLKAPNLATDNTVFTFPPTNGTATQVLSTDGSGNTSWADSSAPSTSAALFSALSDETGGAGVVVGSASPTITSPTVKTSLLLQNTTGSQPELQLSEDPDNGTAKVTIKAVADQSGGDIVLTLPPNDGTTDQVLRTDGSGILTWVDQTGGITSVDLTADVTGVLPPANGGTGVANSATETITLTGDDPITFTTTGSTSVTLPTSGVLATTDDVGNAITGFSNYNWDTSVTTISGSGGGALILDGTGQDQDVTFTFADLSEPGTVNFAEMSLEGDVVSTDGSQNLTAKTLTSPTLVTPALGTPTSGNLANATGYPVASVANLGSGIATFLTTPSSANLDSAVTDDTGSGLLVFATSPTLTTPVLGAATATTINKVTLTAPASGSTLTVADGKTFVVSNNLTLTGSDGTSANLAGGGTVAYTGASLSQFATTTSSSLATVLNDEVGTGKAMFNLGPSIDDYMTFEEAAAPSTPSSGFVALYGKTDKKLYTKNSDGVESAWGAGGGEKNYITSGTNSAASWVASSADLTVATDTTLSELPREFTTASGIKIVGTSNTETDDYVYYDFTLDDVDLSKKLKISWSQKTFGTVLSSDLVVEITTQAARTVVLHTPVVTAIPAVDGVFQTTFDAGTTATLSLKIRATQPMATAGGIVISDVVVGPGIKAHGAVIGPAVSFTPTITASGGGTVTTGTTGNESVGTYWRSGQFMNVEIYWKWGSSSPTFGSSGSYAFGLPAGFTADASLIGTRGALGTGQFYDSSVSDLYGLTVYYDDATSKILAYVEENVNGADFGTTGPVTIASSDFFLIKYTVPITEWAGSGTMNVIQDDTLKEWTSWTPTGSWSANSTYTGSWRRVGDTNEYIVNIALAGAPTAASLTINLPSGHTIDTTKIPGAVTAQMQVGQGTALDATVLGYPLVVDYSTATAVRVLVLGKTGTYVDIGSSASHTIPFTFGNTDNVAVRFSVPIVEYRGKSGTGPVGFAMADTTQAGLVSTTTQSLAGVKTFSDGVKYATTGGTAATLDYYEINSHATTFTFNGTGSPGTTGSITLGIEYTGDWVTLEFPTSILTTTGTNSGTLTANTVLLARWRPLTAMGFTVHIQQGGTPLTVPGLLYINTDGSITLFKDATAVAAFTNGAANTGLAYGTTVRYRVD